MPQLEENLLHIGPALADAELVVYAVHGRGQSPEFMEAIASRVGLSTVAWLMPAAPDNTWYPQGFMRPPQENQPALASSLELVDTQLQAVVSQARCAVVVFGFSQGACLLAEYLLSFVPKVRGAILHTGGYLGPHGTERETVAGLGGMDIRMHTASSDAWVPLERVEETKAVFESVGAVVELTVYEDTDHHVNDDSLARIRAALLEWRNSTKTVESLLEIDDSTSKTI